MRLVHGIDHSLAFGSQTINHHTNDRIMKSMLWIAVALLFSGQALRCESRPESSQSIGQDSLAVGSATNFPSHDTIPTIRNEDSGPPLGLQTQSLPLSNSAMASKMSEERPTSQPRSLVLRTDEDMDPLPELDSTEVDSFPPLVRPKLLPDDMSLMERGLWGESGILRGIGIASPLTPEVRKHELAIRRTMLTMHQIGGFLTLGSMITAVYFGQKSLNDPYTGQRNDPYRSSHQTFVTSTIALYAATGLLAVLSPPPLIRREETSTITIHKTLAWLHVAGMIVTPLIGNAVFKRGPVGRYVDVNQARYHQISAYITTAVFAASLIVVTF